MCSKCQLSINDAGVPLLANRRYLRGLLLREYSRVGYGKKSVALLMISGPNHAQQSEGCSGSRSAPGSGVC